MAGQPKPYTLAGYDAADEQTLQNLEGVLTWVDNP